MGDDSNDYTLQFWVAGSDVYASDGPALFSLIDSNGNTIEEKTEEKVVCDDSVKHFLEEAGVAKNCHEYVWSMTLGGQLVEQKAIACEKLDGSYEIIPSYSTD